jgi:transposase
VNKFSCVEVARQLNVADQNISRWVTAYEQSLQTELSGERPRSELEAELRRLRAENEELRQQKEILKGHNLLCKRAALRFAFIDEQRLFWSVALLCRTMAVSRNGFIAGFRQRIVQRHHQMPSGMPML